MSFIDDIQITIKTKVTDAGRKSLSEGNFNVTKFSIGDSFYDYRYDNPSPFDVFDKPFGSRFLLKTNLNEDGLYNINEIKSNKIEVVNNSKERGQFTKDGNGDFSFIESTIFFKQFGLISGFTDNFCEIDQVTRVEIGDYLLVKINSINNSSTNSIIEDYPYITFKVDGITGNTLELDRKIENTYIDTSKYWVIPSNFDYYDKTPDKYWDKSSNNVSKLCKPIDDVQVWNMNIFYPKTVIGTDIEQYVGNDGYGSNNFAYLLPFLDYSENKQIGVIHYSNNTISNFYGEGFKDNTPIIDLPLIMYHDKNGIGLQLICSETKNTITDNNLFSGVFYDLILEHNSEVVGKCFPNQKIFIIEDEELLASMTYKSNRNHTLPSPNTFLINTTENNDILSNTGETLHVSYQLLSNNHITSLPYQGEIKLSEEEINCGGNFNKLQVTFNEGDFNFITSQALDSSAKFEYNYLRILFQKTEGNNLPNSNEWVYKDFGFSGSTLTADDLENGIFDVVQSDLTGNTYTIDQSIFNLPSLTETDKLTFNDEYIVLGNVNTSIIANIYEMTTYLQLNFNEFNNSTNPTWDENLGYVYISDIGLYNDNNELLVTGSLPNPVMKKNDQNRVILIKIDF